MLLSKSNESFYQDSLSVHLRTNLGDTLNSAMMAEGFLAEGVITILSGSFVSDAAASYI